MCAIKIRTLGVLALGMMWLGAANATEHTIDQHNKTFEKDGSQIEKISVKAGDTIHFRNMDPWFHNVFSLSDLKTFDLGSYPQGQQKPVVFDKTGTVEVECAIHPQMHLEVEVR